MTQQHTRPKVHYTLDQEYDPAQVSREELRQWPTSQLVYWRLKPNELTDADFKVIQSAEYSAQIRAWADATEADFANYCFKLAAKRMILFGIVVGFLGFLFGYYTYWAPTTVFPQLKHLTIFYGSTWAVMLAMQYFVFEVALTQHWGRNMLRMARMPLESELTSAAQKILAVTGFILHVAFHLSLWFFVDTFLLVRAIFG